MCWHMPARVGTFLVSQYPSKVHMTDITGVGTCRHLKVSARVGTCSGVGTFEVLKHVSTSQLPNNIHMWARVGTSKCRHRCRHLPTCRHVPAHRCRHPDCDIHSIVQCLVLIRSFNIHHSLKYRVRIPVSQINKKIPCLWATRGSAFHRRHYIIRFSDSWSAVINVFKRSFLPVINVTRKTYRSWDVISRSDWAIIHGKSWKILIWFLSSSVAVPLFSLNVHITSHFRCLLGMRLSMDQDFSCIIFMWYDKCSIIFLFNNFNTRLNSLRNKL